ncbi:hypothetical protein KKC06_06840 [Patescibacteria group bacterium]|nr:hypothetical protein [Patescibacteria group bacterium]
MDEELNEIRLKEPGDLDENEIKILKEHEKELTDEEKEDYKDVLGEKEEEEEEEEEEEKDKKDKPITFKTQEAFDSAVSKRVEEMQVAAEKKKEEEKEEKKEKRFWPKGKKFKDADDFVKGIIPIIRRDRELYTKEQRAQRVEIDRQLDKETEDLRKIDPSIPSAKSKDRREFDRSLAEIMISDPKITTITQAYGVYKEGLDDGEKAKRKKLASKIGGPGGGGSSKKTPKYEKFAGRTMDDAQEAAEKAFKKSAK